MFYQTKLRMQATNIGLDLHDVRLLPIVLHCLLHTVFHVRDDLRQYDLDSRLGWVSSRDVAAHTERCIAYIHWMRKVYICSQSPTPRRKHRSITPVHESLWPLFNLPILPSMDARGYITTCIQILSDSSPSRINLFLHPFQNSLLGPLLSVSCIGAQC